VLRKLDIRREKNKVEPLHLIQKTNTKGISGVSVRAKTIKLLGKNIRTSL
jgi:hypothetical protein